MVKKSLIFLSFFLFSSFFLFAGSLNVFVDSPAAILMDVNTGDILFAKNIHKQMYPASITKVATALYALESLGNNLDVNVVANQDSIGAISAKAKRNSNYTNPAYWIEFGSTHMGIKKGEELPLRVLLYGLLVASANDSANVIATHVSGSVPRFMDGLNAYLKYIGFEDTYFLNPHGLHHPRHKSSAYDMALIARKALENELFREIVKTTVFQRPKTNKQEPVPLVQSNRLLKRGEFYYQPAFGVKTGYTSDAGYSLIAAAEKNDRVLIAVILGSEGSKKRYNDVIRMFDTAFDEKKIQKQLIFSGKQHFKLKIAKADMALKTYVDREEIIEFYPSQKPEFKAVLGWDDLTLPITKGQKVGVVGIQVSNEKEPRYVELFAANDVSEASWFKKSWGKILAVIIVIFFTVVFIIRRKMSTNHNQQH